MNDFIQRLRRDLEPILAMADPREKISAYHDMPYAIFHYDPTQELLLRGEVAALRTRIENKGKRVTTISLAECLPSVPTMLRQPPAGSLPLRAEVETSHGYAPYH